MSVLLIDLELVEYQDGLATFETDSGDTSLVLTLAQWDAINRPANIRIRVEADL